MDRQRCLQRLGVVELVRDLGQASKPARRWIPRRSRQVRPDRALAVSASGSGGVFRGSGADIGPTREVTSRL